MTDEEEEEGSVGSELEETATSSAETGIRIDA